MKRVLVADDHTLLREALATLLDGAEGIRVVAVAGDAHEAVRLAARKRPNVVLLDVEMPGNDDPPATVRALSSAAPGVQVLVVSMHDDVVLAHAMLAAGASGFLHKSIDHRTLAAAIHSACAPGHTRTVALSGAELFTPDPAESQCALSPRELEVLQLAAQGMSNYQIARRLTIAEGTVKRHMRSIFDKLAARSRVEAANTAVAMGIIAPPVPAPRRPYPADGSRRRQRPMPIPPPTGSTTPVT